MSTDRHKSRQLPRAVAVACVFVSMLYLSWRLLFTIPLGTWWLAIPLWLLEAHTSARFALMVFELWSAEAEPPPTFDSVPGFSVAVVIPTYDEGVDVLLPTVAAALALEPVHQTWVLDDGSRPEIADMARQLGAGYIARVDNSFAKAGNINHALGHIDADLMAVLDADHVAQPGFLTATIPYFVDPELALVQTPPDFYNTNSFVHASKDFHEEQFFHRAIQSGKNRMGAAFWCGTGSLVRLSALRSIGGTATASITEDLQTTMRLHRAGWKTVHHNEVLSKGLAPRTFDEFRNQRWRWGAGAMQAFAIDFPLRAKGLSFGQRLSYFASMASWFDSWRTLGFLLAPLVVIVTGAAPVSVPFGPLLGVSFGVMLAQLFSIRALAGGRLRLWWATLFDVLRLPMNLSSTQIFFRPRGLRFGVTPKGRSAAGQRAGRMPALLRILEWAYTAAWAYGVLVLVDLAPSQHDSSGVLLIALGWTLFNLAVLNTAMTRVTDPRFGADQRGAVRLHGAMSAEMSGHPVEVLDVSMSGARLKVPSSWQHAVADGWVLGFDFPHHVSLECSIRRILPSTPGHIEIGVEFSKRQWFPLADLAMAVLRSGQVSERRQDVGVAG
jgi:cellulose synthase (UDP-forming)